MYNQYYEILGISQDSTISEIKTAFREKAKQFHPDLNTSPDANEKFIAVNEAYTFLLRFHSMYGSNQFVKPNLNDFYSEWILKDRKKARQSAAEKAKMDFEQYRKSPLYKTTSTLNNIGDRIGVVLGAFIILASAFGLYNQGLVIMENQKEVVNVRGIFLIITLTIAGIFFILLSLANIQKRRENSRNI